MVSRQPLRASDPGTISTYRLVARLGEGGMGVVYLAETPDGRLVAVKVIRQHLATHEDFRARFRAEVATASKVARFCTAPILDSDTSADPPYIVTEYIDGPTLGAVVEEHGALPGAQLHALGVGVASALGAIHRVGIMHRDLKPGNVLLSRFGPQVIDFGIARAVDAVTGITQPGRMMGSPSYMAPEQFRGEKLTQKVDIFAWGAIMVYAGTAHQPFGVSTDAVFYQVLYGEPDLQGLDPQIAELVAWALRKEPEQRPTAQQLLDALVGGGGGQAPPGWPAASEPSPFAAGPGLRGDRRGGDRRTGDRPRPASGNRGDGYAPGARTGERMPVEAFAVARHGARERAGVRAAVTGFLVPRQLRSPAAPSPAVDNGPARRPGAEASRHRGAPVRRHTPERPNRKAMRWWITTGVLGALAGASGSFATVSYLDYDDARKASVGAVSQYLTAIQDEDYGAAYGRLCPDITRSATVGAFRENLQGTAGIESFTVDKSVPFRLSGPYVVSSRITEKNGNGHTSLFEVVKESAGSRDRYLVCRRVG